MCTNNDEDSFDKIGCKKVRRMTNKSTTVRLLGSGGDRRVPSILQWREFTRGGSRNCPKWHRARGLVTGVLVRGPRANPCRRSGDEVPQKLKQNVKLLYILKSLTVNNSGLNE